MRARAGRDISTTPWSGGPPAPTPKPAPTKAPLAGGTGAGPSLELSRGTGALLAVNALVFVGAVFAKLPLLSGLALYNAAGGWLQYVTSAFVHANLSHLSRNMFMLWLWGSVLRKEVTSGGLWFAYVACAVGANMAASMALGAKAASGTALLGLASTGGCLGVALAALLLTARPSMRWLVGAARAAQFTLPALLTSPVPYAPHVAGGAAAAGTAAVNALLPSWMATPGAAVGAGSGVAAFVAALRMPAMAWVWGAAAGALLVVVLARLPVPAE